MRSMTQSVSQLAVTQLVVVIVAECVRHAQYDSVCESACCD